MGIMAGLLTNGSAAGAPHEASPRSGRSSGVAGRGRRLWRVITVHHAIFDRLGTYAYGTLASPVLRD